MASRRARITVLTGATLVRAFTFILVARYSTPVLLFLVGIFVLCTTAWQVNLSVLLVDSYDPRVLATASGFTTSFGTFSTILFTAAVGWILQHYSYRPVFVLLSVLSVASYVAVLLILGGTGAARTSRGRRVERRKVSALVEFDGRGARESRGTSDYRWDV